MKNTLVLLIILLSFLSCNQKEIEATKTVITGHVIGFDDFKKHNEISFDFCDILKDNNQQTVKIDADGNFSLDVELNTPTEFTLNYRYRMTYVLVPGDNLHFEIDAKCWKGRHPKEASQYKLYTVSGTGKDLNDDVSAFITLFNDSLWSRKATGAAAHKYDALAYRAYQDSMLRMHNIALSQFNDDYNTNVLFKEWAQSYIRYHNWSLSLNYCFTKAFSTKQNPMEYLHQLPDEYFNFLDELSDKRPLPISSSYTSFLHEYTMYTDMSVPLDSQKVYFVDDDATFDKTFQYMLKHYSERSKGFNHDVLIAKMYYRFLDKKYFDVLKNVYQPELIIDDILRHQIEDKYNFEKKLYENPEFSKGVVLKQISESDVLKEILDVHKGKVIYLDFWAPWCSPCMNEMPHAKKIKAHYVGKDVVFVYLASRCKESAWKATIAENSIKGEHYLLSKSQYEDLKEIFGVSGIPHFALIDQNGIIFEKKTVRPSSKGKLIKKIDALLSQSNTSQMPTDSSTGDAIPMHDPKMKKNIIVKD